MTTQNLPRLFRIITSFAAFSFLMWTLSSSTFLDTSADLVDKGLTKVKNASDRSSAIMSLLADHMIHDSTYRIMWSASKLIIAEDLSEAFLAFVRPLSTRSALASKNVEELSVHTRKENAAKEVIMRRSVGGFWVGMLQFL